MESYFDTILFALTVIPIIGWFKLLPTFGGRIVSFAEKVNLNPATGELSLELVKTRVEQTEVGVDCLLIVYQCTRTRLSPVKTPVEQTDVGGDTMTPRPYDPTTPCVGCGMLCNSFPSLHCCDAPNFTCVWYDALTLPLCHSTTPGGRVADKNTILIACFATRVPIPSLTLNDQIQCAGNHNANPILCHGNGVMLAM
jgi:hypothetical protein